MYSQECIIEKEGRRRERQKITQVETPSFSAFVLK
jgi:hypothetical protein